MDNALTQNACSGGQKKDHNTKNATILNYTKKRFIGYIFITFFVFFSPFIEINGNHIFLLSFVHQKLDLLFVSFSVQELYLMPFLLILLFLFIFFITTLLGRVWCAWACPQTIFRTIYRDIICQKLLKLYQNRKNKQKPAKNKPFAKFISVVLFYIIAILAVSNLMWYFVAPQDFFEYLKNPSEHLILFGIVIFASILFTFDITYLSEQFCVYVCPYARIQSAMYDNDTKQVLYDESRGGIIWKEGKRITQKPLNGECVACEACVLICPNHIDIRKGVQLDCINCLECADACSKTQAKFNRPSLISWTSINAIHTKSKVKYFRFRTIAYMGILCVVFASLLIMASSKTSMLLSINRTSELFYIKSDSIENSYTFLINNTDNKEHEYYFEVLQNDKIGEISIVRPKESIKIGANKKVKKIVVLATNELKVDNITSNVIIPIKIRAFAKDDESIEITNDSIFIYPKKSQIDKKR